MISYVQHLFTCLLVICVSSFGQCLLILRLLAALGGPRTVSTHASLPRIPLPYYPGLSLCRAGNHPGIRTSANTPWPLSGSDVSGALGEEDDCPGAADAIVPAGSLPWFQVGFPEGALGLLLKYHPCVKD